MYTQMRDSDSNWQSQNRRGSRESRGAEPLWRGFRGAPQTFLPPLLGKERGTEGVRLHKSPQYRLRRPNPPDRQFTKDAHYVIFNDDGANQALGAFGSFNALLDIFSVFNGVADGGCRRIRQ